MASALENVPSSSANVDETGEILADGIINLFKPAVEEIDDRVRAVRCVVKCHKVYSTDNLWKLCIKYCGEFGPNFNVLHRNKTLSP